MRAATANGWIPGFMGRYSTRTHRAPVYTTGVSLVGLATVAFAASQPGIDWPVVLLFGCMAGLAEILSVEQVVSSRLSVNSAIILASILVLGPSAGVLTAMITLVLSETYSAIAAYLRHQAPRPGQAPRLQRAAFNIGMLAISAAIAGGVYQALGGRLGDVVRLASVAPMAASAVAYSLANYSLLTGVLCLQSGRSPAEVYRQNFLWALPIEFLVNFFGAGALGAAYAQFLVAGIVVFMLPLFATGYAYLFTVRRERAQVAKLEALNRSLDEANHDLLEALAEVIDAYDAYTLGHSRQVTIFAEAIATRMDLPQEERTRIRRAALIHDIGKVGISETIIGKGGRLTDEEYQAVKRHPDIGAEIVMQMKGLQDIVPLIRHHHERWDGRGYPDQLAGEQIPLGARVIAMADALEAMCSDRPHSKARTFLQILEEIQRCSGSQFDPAVVEAFLQVAAEVGEDFFRNSASIVDHTTALTEPGRIQAARRYLKKSLREA